MRKLIISSTGKRNTANHRPKKFFEFEDKRIIGTSQYVHFQQMCTRAGFIAIKEAKARGLPITYVENDKIIKEYANGRKKILGIVKPGIKVKPVYKIP